MVPLILILIIISLIALLWGLLKICNAHTVDHDVKWDRLDEFRRNANGKPFCPHCGCTEIGTTQNSSKNVILTFNVCKNCGLTWEPKSKYR